MFCICTYEDRDHVIIGLKLMLLSTVRYFPNVPIYVYCKSCEQKIISWGARFPSIKVVACDAEGGGWDVKPAVILDAMDRGYDEVLWLDSDLILTRPVDALLRGHSPGVLVVAEEYKYGMKSYGYQRTVGWRLAKGRTFRRSVNSCAMRATSLHKSLIETWKNFIRSNEYKKHGSNRPIHVFTDQDVLHALLGSRDFAEVPVHFLKRGRDIAQCFQGHGYTTFERLRYLYRRDLPPIVHAQGPKPWYSENVHTLWSELSPYTDLAREYAEQLDEDNSWMEVHSRISRFLRSCSSDPRVQGIPVAACAELGVIWRRNLKRISKVLRRVRGV